MSKASEGVAKVTNKGTARNKTGKKGNKNAVKTGEFEKLTYAMLTDSEKELYNAVPDDALIVLGKQARLLEVRRQRIWTRYTAEHKKARPRIAMLEDLEASLDRLDRQAVTLQVELDKLRNSSAEQADNGALDQLTDILNKARAERRAHMQLVQEHDDNIE